MEVAITNYTQSTSVPYTCSTWTYDYWLGWYQVPDVCYRTTDYYVSNTDIVIEAAATKITFKANKGSVSSKVVSSVGSLKQLKLTFAKLFQGQTRSIRVSYFLPSGAPRSGSTTRVGAAYLRFCAIAWGPGVGDVKVNIPSSFSVTDWTDGQRLSKSTSKGFTTYSGPVFNPQEFFACFEGSDEAAYKTETLTSASGRIVRLQAWPEDAAWLNRTRDDVTAQLTQLETLIGRPLPGTGPVTIRETIQLSSDPFVGHYDSSTSTAYVTEDFSQEGVAAHELSHAWFNRELFAAPWLSEGHAGWAETRVASGGTLTCADPGVAPLGAAAGISDWASVGPRSSDAEIARLDYQYAASCYIIATIANRVGPDLMRAALGALFDRTNPYRSAAAVLPGKTGPADWRAWLDAVDEMALVPAGEADLTFAEDLLHKFGVADDDAALAGRTEARQAYHDYLERQPLWQAPIAVLRPLSDWDFASAETAIATANQALDHVADGAAVLPEAYTAEGPVRAAVEGAITQQELATAAELARDQADAARVVAEAEDQYEAPSNVITDIGLIGTDLRPALIKAVAAVSITDLGLARSAAAEISTQMQNAPITGLIRIAIAVAILLMITFVVRKRRKRLDVVTVGDATDVGEESPASAPAVGSMVLVADMGSGHEALGAESSFTPADDSDRP